MITMTPTLPQLTAEEAEEQLRAIIADADLRDEKLDAFRARLPTMRTSDLVSYIADNDALLIVLGIVRDGLVVDDVDVDRKLVAVAAVLAIKDEIDRRFPVPGGSP